MRNFKTKIRMLTSATALGVAMMVGASVSANAVTFNFADIADNSLNPNYIGATELNWRDTNFSTPGGKLILAGIGVTGSGFNAVGGFADAFFDKEKAGLGVCSTPDIGGGSGCRTGGGTNPADDNVSSTGGGETLKLTFDQFVNLQNISFKDRGHKIINSGSLRINGILSNITGGVLSTLAFFSALNIQVFDFKYIGTEFYIESITAGRAPQQELSPVPLPASVYLFGTGLLGIGFLARRRRRKTQSELKFA